MPCPEDTLIKLPNTHNQPKNLPENYLHAWKKIHLIAFRYLTMLKLTNQKSPTPSPSHHKTSQYLEDRMALEHSQKRPRPIGHNTTQIIKAQGLHVNIYIYGYCAKPPWKCGWEKMPTSGPI